MLGIRVPDPDEAMLISGGKGGTDGAPFRVVVGNRKFVMPFINRVSYLTLAMQEAQVAEKCVTNQGIEIVAKAVCAFKVATDEQSIINAGQRFLSDQEQMPNLVGQIFAGHLRSIIGSMTVEDIVRNRQALATEVLDASKEEMSRLGLLVDSFQIQSIDDSGQGYIAAMAATNIAAVQREAAIAQARADQAAAEARQQSLRQQAQYERDTAIARASNEAEVNKAQADADRASAIAKAEAKRQVAQAEAEADQAGPLAKAQAERAVFEARTTAAAKQAELREQELVSERVKPAQADAESIRIKAQAEAEATRLQAEAAASNDRVALERMIIEQLPSLVSNAGTSLAKANVTVLNGSDGLAQVAAGLVSQALAIYNEAKSGLVANGNSVAQVTNGQPDQTESYIPHERFERIRSIRTSRDNHPMAIDFRAAVYGTISVGALLAAESAGQETYTQTVIAVSLTLVLYVLAHTYSEYTAERMRREEPLNISALAHTARAEAWLLPGAGVPLLAVVIGWVGGASLDTSVTVAVWTSAVMVMVFETGFAIRAHEAGREFVIQAAVGALLGLLVIVLRYVLH